MNIATWLLIAALLGLLYAAVIFVPPYLDNLSVKESTEAAFYFGFTAPEETIVQAVILKVNGGPTAVGHHFEEDENGVAVEVPGLGIPETGVIISRDEASRTMTISVDYDRQVRLIPSKKLRTIHFHVEKQREFH